MEDIRNCKKIEMLDTYSIDTFKKIKTEDNDTLTVREWITTYGFLCKDKETYTEALKCIKELQRVSRDENGVPDFDIRTYFTSYLIDVKY